MISAHAEAGRNLRTAVPENPFIISKTFKLINGIKHESPFLYSKFEEIGGSEKIKTSSELGGIGF